MNVIAVIDYTSPTLPSEYQMYLTDESDHKLCVCPNCYNEQDTGDCNYDFEFSE